MPLLTLQRSLTKMGLDPTLAVQRARSMSRVGRKRHRSLSVAGPAAMDIDGAHGDGDAVMQPPKKRLHSSKSRFILCLANTGLDERQLVVKS